MNTRLALLALAVSLALSSALRAEDPPGGVSEEEFKQMHELRGDAAPAPRGTMIELGGDQVYLSLPAGQGPFPALVVIQEWWGLNSHIKHWADRLAAEGYAALAVDLYGGKVATSPDEAMALMKGLDEARALERVRAAFALLRDDPRVKAPRIGSIGWCLGGAWSLRLALAEPELDACVIYYGRLVTEAERLKAIKAPVCGVFATKDRSIGLESVAAFEQGLLAAGVRHEVHRFEADHAFANPSGTRYASAEAAQAWSKVRDFLARELREKK